MKNRLVLRNTEIEIFYNFNSSLRGADIEEFYSWLGDNDVVTAYEIDVFLCLAGVLYKFGEKESDILMKYGKVKLHKVESLESYVIRNNSEKNIEYYKWYYSMNKYDKELYTKH